MKTIKQLRHEARQLFRLCLVKELLDEARVHQVVQQVLQVKRRDSFVLLSYFLRWVKLERSRHMAEIESAMSLPADLQASVRASLERAYGPGMNSSFTLNPALIGGMRIKVACDVYDGSVQAGLASLERNF